MHCMKCGTELSSDQVFCDSCLGEMERYPVRPGIAVHLPQREELDSAKKTPPRKKAPTPEDALIKLRNAVLWLSGLVLVLAIALGIATVMLVQNSQSNQPDETIGKNYSTIAPNQPVD